MSGAARSNLKIVGGNNRLQPMPKNRRVPPWPPLRVVGVDYVPPTVSAPERAASVANFETRRRPNWALLWVIGLAAALGQSIGQAIAAYYG